MRLIAITGGIGSGKSVVARMLEVMGYAVFDCDRRAKRLMAHDDDVKRRLKKAFGNDIYRPDGTIDRERLSAVAFSDGQALKTLNGIVHPVTISDMTAWAQGQAASGAQCAMVETALLRTAGIDSLVDEVWHVTAPVGVRVERVMARNGLTAAQVMERIQSQSIEEAVESGEQEIINDGTHALLPQLLRLLNQSTITTNNNN